jgi:mono/diheme cytochrome c family protein
MIKIIVFGFIFSLIFNTADSCIIFSQNNENGKSLYIEHCAVCHNMNGRGIPGAVPPLAKADFLIQQPEKSIRAIRYGLSGAIAVNGITYNSKMDGVKLSDQEMADLMNFISNVWGNKSTISFTQNYISQALDTLKVIKRK